MSVIASRNLYIDSSSDVGQGDNFTLQLGGDSIRAGDGQVLKLTLVNFNMYNNTYKVNQTNNKLILTSSHSQTNMHSAAMYQSTLEIPPGNYASVGEIAQIVSELVRELLEIRVRIFFTGISASLSPLDTEGNLFYPALTETFSSGTRILEFKVQFNIPHNIEWFTISCDFHNGESYSLLGGDKQEPIGGFGNLATSFQVSVSSTSEVTIKGNYPMQTSTSPQIYLRCALPNNNIEMSALAGIGPFNTHTLSSNILGVFQMFDEFIHYDSMNDEFFYNLRTKELNHLKLFLTDRKNRPLGRQQGSANQTAAGSGVHQSTQGNLYFTAILRIDTIQATVPRLLQTKPQPLPDYHNQGVLKTLN